MSLKSRLTEKPVTFNHSESALREASIWPITFSDETRRIREALAAALAARGRKARGGAKPRKT